ncbi:unnamed protein product [Ilex paraguariensis]|uniref:DUF4408 domain-containing protein n=1 Tax=Ilex paraguariensis TaxID=185542 RepID=A0ABC8UDG8_9AQUA
MDIDHVKFEKANAISRYRRCLQISKLLQMLEIVVALSLIAWSSTRIPAVFKVSGEYLLEVSAYFLKPHAVFLIGNAIIVALVVISRQNYGSKYTGEAADIYDEDVRDSEIQGLFAASPDGETSLSSPPPPETEECADSNHHDKQIVCLENAVFQLQCDAVTHAIEKATKQIQKFQRTQSEKLKHEIFMKPRRELRRSETEIRELVAFPGERSTMMTSRFTVDSLSNEEFRLTIESFIEKHRTLFKAQKWAEQNH